MNVFDTWPVLSPSWEKLKTGPGRRRVFYIFTTVALMYLDVTVTQDFWAPKMWKILEKFLKGF